MSLIESIKNAMLDKEFLQKTDFLKQFSIFNGLDRHSLGKIITVMYEKDYPKGEVVFKEGEIGKALFLVLSGEVEVIKSDLRQGEKVLAKMKEGNFFGEMALLEEMPRSATLRAAGPTRLGLIYKTNFDTLVEKNPKVGLKVILNLATILSARLRQTSKQVIDVSGETGETR